MTLLWLVSPILIFFRIESLEGTPFAVAKRGTAHAPNIAPRCAGTISERHTKSFSSCASAHQPRMNDSSNVFDEV